MVGPKANYKHYWPPLYGEILIMYLFLSIYPLGLLAFAIHVFQLSPDERIYSRYIELFLLYQIVFSVGLTSLLAFVGLTFMDKYVADYTEWPHSPFEQQLANVNLAFGILGILSIWLRGYFWAATVIGFSIWIFSDGIHHLYHYFVHRNVSKGNIGVPLITDLVVPPLLMFFLYLYFYSTP